MVVLLEATTLKEASWPRGTDTEAGLALIDAGMSRREVAKRLEAIGEDPDGIDAVLDMVQILHQRLGWLPKVISPGGGWGVAYHEDELPQPAIETYVAFIAQRLVEGCQQRDLLLPKLQVEPGRSLVARAGVALYRVGAVKETRRRRWLRPRRGRGAAS